MIPSPRRPRLRFPAALRGVRVRLTLWYLAVLAVVLALSGGAVYTIERQSLTAALDTRLHTRALQLAAYTEPSAKIWIMIRSGDSYSSRVLAKHSANVPTFRAYTLRL